MVEALFEQLQDMREKVIDSKFVELNKSLTRLPKLSDAEMRAAVIESETRDEVIKEMEDRMNMMERMYAKRLMTEVSCR